MKFVITKTKTKEMDRFRKREWGIADVEHFGRAGLWKESSSYICAKEDGKVVGVLHYSIKAGVMKVETIIVSHTRQGQGIGGRLMKKAEEVAKKKKAHKMFLETGRGWRAVPFYKELGFRKTGELKKHYLKRDWIEFSKVL